MAQLTRQHVDSYRCDGFVCPVDVFSPAEAARHRAALEGQEAEYRDGGLPRPINQYHRINAHLVSEVARTVALDRRIIGAVQSLLSPDLMLWSC